MVSKRHSQNCNSERRFQTHLFSHSTNPSRDPTCWQKRTDRASYPTTGGHPVLAAPVGRSLWAVILRGQNLHKSPNSLGINSRRINQMYLSPSWPYSISADKFYFTDIQNNMKNKYLKRTEHRMWKLRCVCNTLTPRMSCKCPKATKLLFPASQKNAQRGSPGM